MQKTARLFSMEHFCDLMDYIAKTGGNEESLVNFAPVRMHPTQTKTNVTKKESESEDEKKSDVEEIEEDVEVVKTVSKKDPGKITSFMKRKREPVTDKSKKKKE
jgi:hypothetical protein